MKIIVGLGNPGNKYENTRHNAGFLAIDHYLKDKETISCQSAFQAKVCELHQDGVKIFFVKPTTFMNLSGEAVSEIAHFYKIDFKTDLLVIHDEIDLPFGEIRSTENSRAAGHNGVQNIIDMIGTQEFNRIRIGVDSRTSREEFPTQEYVLSPFSNEELEKLDKETLPKVNELITKFIHAK